MRTQLLNKATLVIVMLTGLGSPIVFAHPESKPMQEFARLDLSAQQKQAIKAIFKTTRENNLVFKGEKKEIMAQMETLMNMPSWDPEYAKSIIETQLQQGQKIALNRAKAKHLTFQLLSDEQKEVLAQRHLLKAQTDDRKTTNAKKGDGHKNRHARLEKALELNDSQIQRFSEINENARQQMLAIKGENKAHREKMRTIIQAPNFDEDAWLDAQSIANEHQLNVRLIRTKAHYERLALLDEDQQQKMVRIMKRMKTKRSGIQF